MLPTITQQLDLKQEHLKQKEQLKKQPEPYTSAYFTDHQRERQVIDEAFSADQSKAKVEAMHNQSKQPRHGSVGPVNQKQPLVKLHGGGYFTAFEYTPIAYDYARQQNIQDRQAHTEKQKQICQDNFKPMKNIKKMKYEDPFNFTGEQKEYLFPFYIPEDYYDLTKESITRQRVIEEAKVIAGSFIPPGIKKPYSKSYLEDMMNIIKEIVVSDWPESQIMIGVTSKDSMEVVFLISSLNGQLGLLTAYMNSLINDERIAHYQLSRVIQLWAIKNEQEGTLLFTIKPPWISLSIDYQLSQMQEFLKTKPEHLKPLKESVPIQQHLLTKQGNQGLRLNVNDASQQSDVFKRNNSKQP